jgi:hypothetical protein
MRGGVEMTDSLLQIALGKVETLIGEPEFVFVGCGHFEARHFRLVVGA